MFYTTQTLYNICNVYQRLATPNGVSSYTNVLHHNVLVNIQSYNAPPPNFWLSVNFHSCNIL